mmetsp:Transcript_7570/g.22695  ORF Transcript_7570/g.22695 Transcript_7570/m.22695 type:complete len:266 (+) Transcript_7570:294-1091(+)
MDELDGQSLGGGARLRGVVLHLDSDIEADGCQVWKVGCEESRLLLERLPVDLLVVGCLRLRACARQLVRATRPVLHLLCTRGLVRRRALGLLRASLRVLQDRGTHGHRLAAARRETGDCASVVAPLDGLAVLLALLLDSHRHWLVVRGHELLSALGDVRLLRPDGYSLQEVRHSLRDLHHFGTAVTDARGHVRDDQGGDVPEFWPGLQCEPNELCAGLDDVLQLLRPLLQALHRQLCDKGEECSRVGGASPEGEVLGAACEVNNA